MGSAGAHFGSEKESPERVQLFVPETRLYHRVFIYCMTVGGMVFFTLVTKIWGQ